MAEGLLRHVYLAQGFLRLLLTSEVLEYVNTLVRLEEGKKTPHP